MSIPTLPENVSSIPLTANSRDLWQNWVHFLEGIADNLWDCPSLINPGDQPPNDQPDGTPQLISRLVDGH